MFANAIGFTCPCICVCVMCIYTVYVYCVCVCNAYAYCVCVSVMCLCLCVMWICICTRVCACVHSAKQSSCFLEVLSVTADFKPVRFMDRIPIQEYMEYNIEFLLSSITQNSYNGIIACCLKKGIQHSGGELLPYIGYTGTCRWEGYGFQAIYSGIGSSNHRKFV